MNQPLVTVICLCYNHEAYVREAVESVLTQSYPSIEIIVVDDASEDGSVATIQNLVEQHPEITFLALPKNLGNCAAFNRGLALAHGLYIADLAADDQFMPDRIEKQVALFQTLPNDYGIVFTDALITDEKGVKLWGHEEYLLRHNIMKSIPQGDIFSEVIQHYFISSPTLLMKKALLDQLGGYDESLTYEDFDIIVRFARHWKFARIAEQLTKVRKLSTGMSAVMHGPGDPKVLSTFLICKKIDNMIKAPSEQLALINRLKYEWRQSIMHDNKEMGIRWTSFLREKKAFTWLYSLIWSLYTLGFPISKSAKILNSLSGVRNLF
ncbi:MAG: glycosyltransferase [Cyclobacteriaceae bacterium]|nr:glycosyltransferase [Cyclobacteriaceae bacterium]